MRGGIEFSEYAGFGDVRIYTIENALKREYIMRCVGQGLCPMPGCFGEIKALKQNSRMLVCEHSLPYMKQNGFKDTFRQTDERCTFVVFCEIPVEVYDKIEDIDG